MKKILNRIFSRLTVLILSVVLQVGLLLAALILLNEKVTVFYVVCRVMAALLALYLVYREGNPAYKIAWLLPILTFPVFGILLFAVFGKNRLSRRERERMQSVGDRYRKVMADTENAVPALTRVRPEAAVTARYLAAAAGAPLFRRTETTYLPVGEAFYATMLDELRKAQKFILMEFYIIRSGRMWREVHEILRDKAAAGVEVRLIYDDFGSLFKIEDDAEKVLRQEGIRVSVFNPLIPELSVRFNNRDHRKIVVIDGNVGFTGGINLSDEYINAKPRCGHWLDSGVMLRGEGVWGLSGMFLSMWDYISGENSEVDFFRPAPAFLETVAEDGFVQPFGDTPLDDEPVGETVYRHMIQRAQEYVYINTPYLIIDNEMLTAMTMAAKSGVDVRVVTPAICDSRLIQELSRSYHEPLLRAGVRVYEYTPGMVHAKTFVSDDATAVVGSINLDYRSLYLHFECAAWMCGSRAVSQMKAAYLDEVEKCREITLADCRNRSVFRWLLWAVLRVFAPLL
ncbi:MAG: cardiolipin synthase [Oscillospiraceae bacterium]|nr:cardiolipin synthase [Oscillospiraceae bacterium]